MKSLGISLACSLLVLAGAASQAAAQAESSPFDQMDSAQPDARETLILELINRARANPQEDIARCLATPFVTDNVDNDMFDQEMQQIAPAPPVFFDDRLQQAARWHASYLTVQNNGEEEDPQVAGFMGRTPSERCVRAEYREGRVEENSATGFTNPQHWHALFVIDPDTDDFDGVEGPGGMQAGRPQREATFGASWKLVGIASEFQDHKTLCIDFGESRQRYVGGVIYHDADGDNFYSIGEGVGGTTLRQGRQSTTGYHEGAYTLRVTRAGGELTMNVGTLTFTHEIPEGNENVKIDFVLNAEQKATLETLLAEKNFVMDAIYCGNLEEATTLHAEMSEEYSETPLAEWYHDASLALEMRSEYCTIAQRYRDGQTPTEAVLERSLKKLLRLQGQIVTDEWKAVGQGIGEAFVRLGQSGDISAQLTSEQALDISGFEASRIIREAGDQ